MARVAESALSSRRAALWCIFSVWVALISVPLAALHVNHVVSFPVQDSSAVPHVAFPEAPSWRMIHYLAPNCGCSLNLSDHLVSRSETPLAAEEIWVPQELSEKRIARLRTAGFEVRRIAPQAARQIGIPGGPWLLIVGPDGGIRYSGGHTEGNAVVGRYCDIRILQELKNGDNVASKPSWGCSIDPVWQRQVDPLGLKY